ncbi:thioredoxin TrxC [Martelella alba]|uniref:Thioredoxin n=1 Tax=Martelella alba TaxID=2590451 RepID=A0ABY2SIN1_9HYPH|nr:thioredoxin TrxC [Martelella alba]TKI05289.1 thioredoxin TrxC [Martelella alba]
MNTVCPSCLATNRLPEDRVGDGAKCGRCGTALLDGRITHATGQTLDTLLQDDLPVVVDFWAPWCGPCVGFAPIFETVAAERRGKVRFLKVNTEAEPQLAIRFGIRSIPTIMVFRNGRQIDALHGALPKGPFEEWLDESLSIPSAS